MPVSYYLLLSGALFAIGVVGMLVRRNIVMIVLAAGLMSNAAILSFAAFARHYGRVDGQVMGLLILAVGAAAAIVGLALFIALFRNQKIADVDEVDRLRW